MEDEVKDAILLTITEDEVLDLLLEVTINSIATKRPLFDNPLVEPHFYRLYFKRWVEEGLEERRKAELGAAPPPAVS